MASSWSGPTTVPTTVVEERKHRLHRHPRSFPQKGELWDMIKAGTERKRAVGSGARLYEVNEEQHPDENNDDGEKASMTSFEAAAAGESRGRSGSPSNKASSTSHVSFSSSLDAAKKKRTAVASSAASSSSFGSATHHHKVLHHHSSRHGRHSGGDLRGGSPPRILPGSHRRSLGHRSGSSSLGSLRSLQSSVTSRRSSSRNSKGRPNRLSGTNAPGASLSGGGDSKHSGPNLLPLAQSEQFLYEYAEAVQAASGGAKMGSPRRVRLAPSPSEHATNGYYSRSAGGGSSILLLSESASAPALGRPSAMRRVETATEATAEFTESLAECLSKQADTRVHFGASVALQTVGTDEYMVVKNSTAAGVDGRVVVGPTSVVRPRDVMRFKLIEMHDLGRSFRSVEFGDWVWFQIFSGSGEPSWKNGSVLGAKVYEAARLPTVSLLSAHACPRAAAAAAAAAAEEEEEDEDAAAARPLAKARPPSSSSKAGPSPAPAASEKKGGLGRPVPVRATLPSSKHENLLSYHEIRMRNENAVVLGRFRLQPATNDLAKRAAKRGNYVCNMDEVYLEQDFYYISTSEEDVGGNEGCRALTLHKLAQMTAAAPSGRTLVTPGNGAGTPTQKPGGKYRVAKRGVWRIRVAEASTNLEEMTRSEQRSELLMERARRSLQHSDDQRHGSRKYATGTPHQPGGVPPPQHDGAMPPLHAAAAREEEALPRLHTMPEKNNDDGGDSDGDGGASLSSIISGGAAFATELRFSTRQQAERQLHDLLKVHAAKEDFPHRYFAAKFREVGPTLYHTNGGDAAAANHASVASYSIVSQRTPSATEFSYCRDLLTGMPSRQDLLINRVTTTSQIKFPPPSLRKKKKKTMTTTTTLGQTTDAAPVVDAASVVDDGTIASKLSDLTEFFTAVDSSAKTRASASSALLSQAESWACSLDVEDKTVESVLNDPRVSAKQALAALADTSDVATTASANKHHIKPRLPASATPRTEKSSASGDKVGDDDSERSRGGSSTTTTMVSRPAAKKTASQSIFGDDTDQRALVSIDEWAAKWTRKMKRAKRAGEGPPTVNLIDKSLEAADDLLLQNLEYAKRVADLKTGAFLSTTTSTTLRLRGGKSSKLGSADYDDNPLKKTPPPQQHASSRRKKTSPTNGGKPPGTHRKSSTRPFDEAASGASSMSSALALVNHHHHHHHHHAPTHKSPPHHEEDEDAMSMITAVTMADHHREEVLVAAESVRRFQGDETLLMDILVSTAKLLRKAVLPPLDATRTGGGLGAAKRTKQQQQQQQQQQENFFVETPETRCELLALSYEATSFLLTFTERVEAPRLRRASAAVRNILRAALDGDDDAMGDAMAADDDTLQDMDTEALIKAAARVDAQRLREAMDALLHEVELLCRWVEARHV